MEAIVRTGSVIALAFAAAFGATTSAGASPINTGVDVLGGLDQAWSVSGTNGYAGPAFTVLNSTAPPPGYPGAWVTNPASNWDSATLGANGTGLDPSSDGFYVYKTTFSATLGGTLSGMFAADNEVSEILLNGVSIYTGPLQTGQSPNQYGFWTDFSGATLASNTLMVFVTNYGYDGGPNPTGLDVVFTPVPSTWTMLIAGFVGLGFFAYHGTKNRSAGLATT
jgi:hypothetical protein